LALVLIVGLPAPGKFNAEMQRNRAGVRDPRDERFWSRRLRLEDIPVL